MSEPPNPASVGVASILKSLRTRAGLREDRLSDTELVLDPLLGLDGVRELMAAGEPTERAIVRAVRSAAGTLDPTNSIVVDASLGLELSAGLIDDTELYARDLGLRRAALLRNWDRLHQLRSVRPGKPPSARALRLEVEADALGALADALTAPGGSAGYPASAVRTVDADEARQQPDNRPQLLSPGSAELQTFGAELRKAMKTRKLSAREVASRMPVPLSVVTGWLDGTDLPSETDANRLDECLTARGAIMQLADELRVQPVTPGATQPGTETPLARSAFEPSGTLGEVFRNVAASLRGCLSRADDGTPLGWPQDLRQLSNRPPTPVSTAYGLRTMLLLEGDLAPDLVPVAENLRRMSAAAGLLAGQPAALDGVDPLPSPPPPEVIALVTDALHRVDGTASLAAEVAAMRDGLGDFEKSRPFILAVMLDAGQRLHGADELTKLLAESLLEARRPYGTMLLWPEKTEALLMDPAPSLAHTARAVRALARLLNESPDEQLQDAVEQGVSWLLEQRQFPNTSDVVDRLVRGQVVSAYTRHFTAAWVIKALVSAGIPATHPTVSNAIGQVWDSYAGDTASLWKWQNGDLPVWLTFDAVEALQLASQAVPARPGR